MFELIKKPNPIKDIDSLVTQVLKSYGEELIKKTFSQTEERINVLGKKLMVQE